MYDDAETHLATPSEARAEYARNAGRDHPDRAWILTDWDTWEPNPFYCGPPVPHPESYDPADEASEPPGFDSPRDFESGGRSEADDFIPF